MASIIETLKKLALGKKEATQTEQKENRTKTN